MNSDAKRILIADDESEIRAIVELLLRGEGYDVISVADGQAALDRAAEDIDLYLLDVNMPRLSGIPAAAQIRRRFDAPIVFLTAYSGESDKVMGFAAGADDYIVKPFSNVELLMRVKAILRRTAGKTANAKPSGIPIADLLLDPDSRTLSRGGETIPLTHTEFAIVELLATHKKKIYSLDNIYQSVWGEDAVGDGAIMAHIKNIRKKLGDDSRNPIYIKTAWGRGYYID
ncbi:MAG: response regulator transcription factor [Ruminococcaceae bacterium]|nr:response regulator transcription factor [Oscillospiraceae bacterium]